MKCPNCGAMLKDGICEYCGYTAPKPKDDSQPTIIVQNVIHNNNTNINQNVSHNVNYSGTIYVRQVSSKSKVAALILCILFGWLGVHHFYVGRIGMGILYLFTFGLFGIGWIVDIILILCGRFKDRSGLYLK